MNRILLLLAALTLAAVPAHASILVFSPNGTYTIKPDLATAAAAPDAAGKTVVVTSALSAVQSNISTATVHAWPADRALSVVKGGAIGNTTTFRTTGSVTLNGGTFTGAGKIIISGPFSAPLAQIFTGAGSVVFTAGSVPEIYLQWWGAKGDGATDDYPAFVAALAAVTGGTLIIPDPAVAYKIGTAKITIPVNTTLRGRGKRTTKLLHAWNGDMFEMSDGAGLENLYLEGQGATFTGKGLVFSGTNGNQKVNACRIINFNSACLDFAVAAGSVGSFIDVEAYRTAAGTGTGRYAVVIDPAQQLTAVPRKFAQFQTGGQCSFSFGGGGGVYISDSFLSDLAYSTETREVLITNSRLANQAALTINGHNNTIVSCDVSPVITIASGADNIAIEANSYNAVNPVVDNSGNGRNLVSYSIQTYTPVLGASGGSPLINNGALFGRYLRSGSLVRVEMEFTYGSTTSLGTGPVTFSLPSQVPYNGDLNPPAGTVTAMHGGVTYTGVVAMTSGLQTIDMRRDTSGQFTAISPVTWTTGDTFRLSFSYRM